MKTTLTLAALVLLSTSSMANDRRTYDEPYPYQKSDSAKGYQTYRLHGCGDYELRDQRIVHICDRRSAAQILKTTDREAHGADR